MKDVVAPASTVAPKDDRRIPGTTAAAKDERREVPPSDIFISYEHHDRDKARMLANALGARKDGRSGGTGESRLERPSTW